MIKVADQPEALLAWMDALADPTRLRLLTLLERHELGVAELCDILQAPQSTVSRHLKLLVDGGWTQARRAGTANFYVMAVDQLAEPARKLWRLARQQVQAGAAFKQDQLRLERLLADRQDQTRQFFADAADRWDKLRDELYGRAFIYELLTAMLPGDLVVADLGCGTGDLVEHMAPCVGQVIGVDHTPAMLEAATQRTRQLKNVELRQGDLTRIPLQDNACDVAVLSLVLTYVPEPIAVLREAARVVRFGGRIVLIDLLEHDRDDFRREMGQRWPGFDPRQLNEMLTLVGMDAVHVASLAPQPQVKGPALLLARGEKSPDMYQHALQRLDGDNE